MGDNSHSWQSLLSTLASYSLYSLGFQCSCVVPPCLVGQRCEFGDERFSYCMLDCMMFWNIGFNCAARTRLL